MYDLNMKEIKFPEGLMPLDIFVGSIAKERATETIEGRSGIVDYGTNYVDRSVELSMWINSSYTTDYRLLRNELYALFDTGNAFYIEETRVPSRVLKVAVDESFIPDRLTIRNASVDVTCRTLDSVFWESKYTTLELHDSGYSATAEKYGLVDNIDDEKVKYRFEYNKEILETIDLTNLSYIYGFISGTGSVSQIGTGSYTLNEGFINITKGSIYQFLDEGNNPQINYWWLYMYNEDESLIERISLNSVGDGRNHTFTAKGSKLKIMINPNAPYDENRISPSRIGVDVLPLINRLGAKTFTVYNAGNVTIEPESMFLRIIASYVNSPGNFTIRNKTTGDEFVLKRASSGYHVRLIGMIPSLGGITNIFRDTNRRFIRLAPGANEFEVLNGSFTQISIDFKYYYK